jgi:hypothetical protein
VGVVLQNQHLRETRDEQVRLLKEQHAQQTEAQRKTHEQTLVMCVRVVWVWVWVWVCLCLCLCL